MRITVTQEHIDAGQMQNGFKCPIALAAQEAIPNKRVGAGVSKLLLFEDNMVDCENISLPPEAKEFVFDFDMGKEVKPFEFEVEYETC